MDEAAALRIAILLIHGPSRIPHVRLAALPEGVPLLLQVAAGDEEALARAAALTGRPAPAVAEAAAFFIEQILLAPEADSYRVLGGAASSGNKDLRRNMALLLRWLHPDAQRHGERSIFAKRVSLAWDDLKTPERRAAYDRTLQAAPAGRSRRRPQVCAPKPRPRKGRRLLVQALNFLFAGGRS